jgi:hypothetical protein
MKVFLGGTCSGYNWRSKLERVLKCDYYNPVVKDWNEQHRLREVQERETADYVLYVITSGIKGVYSIAEVVDDSHKRPDKTIFCVLYENMDRQMAHSLRATANLLKDNGIRCFESLSDTAKFLNEQVKND